MVLSSYNGGLTWLNRDKKLTKSRGGNPQKWWNNVENFSQRADWAIIENRNYARKIIYEHQSIYGDWGKYYICEEY
jgi:membrane-bound lytic murein transglycosylase MltF